MKADPLKILFYAVGIVTVFFTIVLLWPHEKPVTSSISVAASPACADVTPKVDLLASAAYAKDLKTGLVLYEKNADAALPLASLTKLATALTAFDSLSPEDTITITNEDLSPDGDAGLRVGESWKAQDLLDFTLMVSANDGIHAIARAAAEKKRESLSSFIDRMNVNAKSLGMNATYFASDTGLDVSTTTASAYGSAKDVATLMTAIVKKNSRLVESTHKESALFISLSGHPHLATNTSNAIASVGGGIASKTGYTDLAGGNLVIVFEPLPGRPVVAVILGSTREGRDKDMEELAAKVKRALKRVILCRDGLESP